MMTFFNEIGSRKIHGEHNVFAGMHRNPLFIGILVVTFIAQVFHCLSRLPSVVHSGVISVIPCLHNRANIEQLARRFMIISMLIRRAGGL